MRYEYDMIDRFLRNNLDDEDYETFSQALDELAHAAQTQTEYGISFDEWIQSAMRVYMAVGDSEEVALRCAAYLWGEMDILDIPCPYAAALSDVEGRGQFPPSKSLDGKSGE